MHCDACGDEQTTCGYYVALKPAERGYAQERTELADHVNLCLVCRRRIHASLFGATVVGYLKHGIAGGIWKEKGRRCQEVSSS